MSRLIAAPLTIGIGHMPPLAFQAQPLPGVGDAAFFHNNRNQYAELMVRCRCAISTFPAPAVYLEAARESFRDRRC